MEIAKPQKKTYLDYLEMSDAVFLSNRHSHVGIFFDEHTSPKSLLYYTFFGVSDQLVDTELSQEGLNQVIK